MIAADLATTLGDTAGAWAYLIIGVLTGLEAAAFVGLFIPGETTLLLAGYLVHRGELDLGAVMAVAIVGAVIGDSLGYEIGRRYGPRLRSSWLGRRIGNSTWDRAHDQIRRHGPRSVLIGRFVGVLRAVVPAVVGDARMPYWRFLFWNLVGAVVWVPSVVLVGVLAGESYEQVAGSIGDATTALALVGALLGMAVVVRRRRGGRVSPPVVTTDRPHPSHETPGGAPNAASAMALSEEDPREVMGRIFLSASLQRAFLKQRYGEPAAQAMDGIERQLLDALVTARSWAATVPAVIPSDDGGPDLYMAVEGGLDEQCTGDA